MNSFLAYHPTYSTADLLSEYYYYFTKETGDAQRGGRGWQIVLVMTTMQLKQLKGEKIYIVSWFQKDLTQSIMVGKARLWEHEQEVPPSSCSRRKYHMQRSPRIPTSTSQVPPWKGFTASTHHHGLGTKAWKLLAYERTFKVQIQGHMARNKQHWDLCQVKFQKICFLRPCYITFHYGGVC